ncbi:uncharacterized protein LOC124646339 [Helicoverpa zea]|uniref:uncharacterized protein LOC124646339 n=1 Tax=Helicoverpa zea TaxID=7113 RepID=UPI001F564232|nr:uncharacterized protein LOC124646339 [Helicoverpa zea]
MNSMNYIGQSNLRLCSRNEGKIKSYESCRDVRAWSHDVRARDRYLREWIKCDMPICVLPTSTLASFMRTMTCRSRGRATPRCHPDCKSKVVLDSICDSCNAIKECLKNEEGFDKYFDDEEFETSHWPCDRCLEALKSIKMFWKIIIEKIFHVNIPKDEDLAQNECCRTDSVRSVAKVWQTEMVQQAMFVRNISPYLTRAIFPIPCCWKGKKSKREPLTCPFKPQGYPDGFPECKKKCSLKDCRKPCCKNNRSTDTDFISNPSVCRSNKSCSTSQSQRVCSKHCAAKVRLVDKQCHCNEISEEINAYKINLEKLQDKCNCQKTEIDKLKKENSSLKIELQNVYKNSSWKSTFFSPFKSASKHDSVAILPKPFECCTDDIPNVSEVKGIDSEMIITMKNCKNETYRHISLLQVLHKTNDPDKGVRLSRESDCCSRKEDPIVLLTKVQNTFGAIVKREMGIAYERKLREKKSVINASFHKVNASKSAPSCSTITDTSTDSRCDFRLIHES